jgi:hypothetical protein
MPYPIDLPADPTPGDEILASWGDDVRAALSFLANPPACRVYRSTTQTGIASSTKTAITFNSERYDTDGMHNTASDTSRITVNTAGLYLITAHMAFGNNTTNDRACIIRLNGVTEIADDFRRTLAGGDWVIFSIALTYKFVVGDFVEMIAWQNSGVALDVQASGNMTPEFSATWVGRG